MKKLMKTFIILLLLTCLSCKKSPDELFISIKNGEVEKAIRLINEGVDVTAKDIDGYQPVHMAALRGYKEIVELLIKKGVDIEARSSEGCTPLHLAAINDHVNIIEMLLLKKANVNTLADNGDTPLHFAALGGRVKAAEILIENGAEINAKNDNGHTPLWTAIVYPRPEAIEVANVLLDKGADVDLSDDFGYTPLHNAVFWGEKSDVLLLLKYNADINIKTKKEISLWELPAGTTPLDIAIIRDETEIADILKAKGARRNITKK